MISFPGVMGPRDLPDVPLVDDNHQYETHRVVLATSRAESTLSQNTLSTLTYCFISQVLFLSTLTLTLTLTPCINCLLTVLFQAKATPHCIFSHAKNPDGTRNAGQYFFNTTIHFASISRRNTLQYRVSEKNYVFRI